MIIRSPQDPLARDPHGSIAEPIDRKIATEGNGARSSSCCLLNIFSPDVLDVLPSFGVPREFVGVRDFVAMVIKTIAPCFRAEATFRYVAVYRQRNVEVDFEPDLSARSARTFISKRKAREWEGVWGIHSLAQ